MADSIGPTPRNGILGALADALTYMKGELNAPPTGGGVPAPYRRNGLNKEEPIPPQFGTMLLGRAPEEIENWSYGNWPMHMTPLGGPQFKQGRADSLADATLLGAGALGKAVKPAAGALSMLEGSGVGPQVAREMARGAVRLKGGNFDEQSLQDYLAAMSAGAPDKNGASAQWASKQLANYLRKDLGSPTDPLLQVEKEVPGLHLPGDELQARGANMFPQGYLAQHRALTGDPTAVPSPWAMRSDKYLGKDTVGSLLENGLGEPWMQKAKPETPIYNLDNAEGDRLGFGHVLDYLDAAQAPTDAMKDAGLAMTPEQVARTSVADAVRKTARWNELLKSQAVNSDLQRGIARTVKEYPEQGLKWVELGSDNPDELKAGLNAEGAAMGHCVGGYCDKVQQGTKIFSLRDAKGVPHVTIEAAPDNQPSIAQWAYANKPDIQAKMRDMGGYLSTADKATLAPEYQEYLRQNPALLNIRQIKGKANAAPIEKYLPAVQDFVKNGNWGDVYDLENTGLIEVPGPQKYMTADELRAFATPERLQAWRKYAPAKTTLSSGEPMTDEQLLNWQLTGSVGGGAASAYYHDGPSEEFLSTLFGTTPKAQGYAAGGEIKTSKLRAHLAAQGCMCGE